MYLYNIYYLHNSREFNKKSIYRLLFENTQKKETLCVVILDLKNIYDVYELPKNV